jgi:hypothetical protein
MLVPPSTQCFFLAWPRGKPPYAPPDTISFDSVAMISPWTSVVVDTLGLSLGPPLNDARYTLQKYGLAYWWQPRGDSLYIHSSTGESGIVIRARRDERSFAGLGFAAYDVIVNGRAETSDTFPFYARPVTCS